MKKLYFVLTFLLFTHFSISQDVYDWFPVASGTNNNLNSLTNSLISGAGGTILYSINNGYNWIPHSSGTNNELRSIYVGTNYIYISGANGTLLKSSDNGNSWTSLNTGTVVTLNSVSRWIYQNSIMTVGNSGTIIYSSDDGVTWYSMTSGTSNNLYSIQYNGLYAWIAGAGGIILATTNFGTNWFQQSSGTTNNLNYILRIDNNNLWIVGDNGIILSTTNGGTSWINYPSGTTSNLKSITVQTTKSWCVGSGGIVLLSTNSGINWTVQPSFTTTDLNSVYFFNDDFGLVAGNNGLIYMRRPDSLSNLNGNDVRSYFYNTGLINSYIVTGNPGFEWPKGTGQDAVFSGGLTIAAKYNGNLRMAAASFNGEYLPGCIIDSAGTPTPKTSLKFKIYKVSRGDNMHNNPDWLYWGLMVPFGAPFIDVNHDGRYEPDIDTPGVKGAAQTIFLCMTDGFPESHIAYEGFGGGTLPLYAESHMTAWCYDAPDFMDVQFIKWDVINRSHTPWTSAYFSITSDPDMGCPNDDYIGCDTIRDLAFCYNGEDIDCIYDYRYNSPVPAFGFLWLNCNGIQNQGLSSIDYFTNPNAFGPVCERDPNPGANLAYNYIKGTKSDGTPWVIPPGGPQNITKYCYSGDPESGQGWCEAGGTISGSVQNCGGPGITTGNIIASNPFGDRRLILNSGSDNLTINPGDTHKVMIAQLIARGTSRKNSVTKLKVLADTIKAACNRGFIIGVGQISSSFPNQFYLSQNYPNPFNPKTVINYQIPTSSQITLIIYNVLGEMILVLVNEKQNAGSYKVEWDGSNFASGVYFYKFSATSGAGNYTKTNKMILLK